MVALNAKKLDAKTLESTLSILLKHESDLQRAKRILQRPSKGPGVDDLPDMRKYGGRN